VVPQYGAVGRLEFARRSAASSLTWQFMNVRL
jgi:hypothetical protein